MKLLSCLLVAGTLTLASCTADKTEEGELPDVDVSADPGKVPEYDVDPARVEVNRDTQTVVTPDVDVVPDTSNRRQ